MNDNNNGNIAFLPRSIGELCKKPVTPQTGTGQCAFGEVEVASQMPTGNRESFFIPDYQRGYRWTSLHVEQLGKDLRDFYKEHKQDGCWYCLQPLVVKKNIDEKWVVIDGQQRLTTVFIILKALGEAVEKLYSLEYQTRTESKDFLEELGTLSSPVGKAKDLDNPDFYHMQVAYGVIEKIEWPEQDKEKFREWFLGHVKFIWYETNEADDKGVFDRLNSGKISLSNAELIKALLLNINNFQEKKGYPARLQQDKMAQEWDFIEQALHKNNDEFWCFINPKASDPGVDKTRIDFIFDLLLRVYKDKYILKDNEARVGTPASNPYYAFAVISDHLRNKNDNVSVEKTWEEVMFVFRTIKNWYEDRETYHLIGFLMNQKGADSEEKCKKLEEYIAEYKKEPSSKKGFLARLKRDSFNTLGLKLGSEKREGVLLDTLTYKIHDNQINNTLLLFNIALLNRQSNEESRYPFKTHRGTAWSLEHIHAKKQRHLKKEDVVTLLETCGIKYEAGAVTKFNELFSDDVLLKQEEGKEDEYQLEVVNKEDTIHGIANLALLECKQNAAFNDSLYLEKRAMLTKWEGCNKQEMMKKYNLPDFIPLGTRMVFFKHFSSNPNPPFVWSETDQNCYFDVIGSTLTDYLELKPEEGRLLKRSEG